ncbi:response regulator [Nitrincola sp. MINF-07-Sa-05]|uniref:response regulator n=1 Tax=Nitrincola salilacus TaxID=3400273 RepID=UPI0039182DDF
MSTLVGNHKILIATDNIKDADIITEMLQDEFEDINSSTDPECYSVDFERLSPTILLLAFNALEKAERYLQLLSRQCPSLHQKPYRTIVLCNKSELKQAYLLCKNGFYDDYVLFWPLSFDMLRLPMTIHHALRDLKASDTQQPPLSEFNSHIRNLEGFDSALEENFSQGEQFLQGLKMQASEIEKYLEELLSRLTEQMPENSSTAEGSDDHDRQNEIINRLNAVSVAVEALRQWSKSFRLNSNPYIQSIKSLGELADAIRPTVLVVDDDKLQQRLMEKMLNEQNFIPVFAANGFEALSALRRVKPDLILMDIVMPEMDGIEATRQVRKIPGYSDMKIIMMTGKREKDTVMEAIEAGATDFIVKPVDSKRLLAKITKD